MKQTIFIAAIILAFCVCVYWILDLCTDTEHKYEISYNHGKYSYSDYTDTFKLTPTSIEYRDERGRQVVRSGTFSVRENQDYKK